VGRADPTPTLPGGLTRYTVTTLVNIGDFCVFTRYKRGYRPSAEALHPNLGLVPNVGLAPNYRRLRYQWVAGGELREGGEVAIGGPQFVDSVVQAECRDAGVVDSGSLEFGFQRKLPKFRQVAVAFGE